MFPSSFRPVSENRHLRKLSNVHSPMCVMSCVRFGNFFLGKFVKYFSREMLLLGGFLILRDKSTSGNSRTRHMHWRNNLLLIGLCCSTKCTESAYISCGNVYEACEKQGWLSSRKKTFLLCNAILVFFFPPGLLGLGYNREDLFSRGGLGALGFGLNWGLEDGMGFAE